MNWLLPALLAPALYVVVTCIDKYVISKRVTDYDAMPIYSSIIGLIVGCIFWIVTGYPLLSWFNASIVLTTGILTSLATITYYKALAREDTSNINILIQISPLCTLTLAYFFLHETLTIQQIYGFILVLSAIMIISIKVRAKAIRLSRTFFLLMIVVFLLSLSGILVKFAINLLSFFVFLL